MHTLLNVQLLVCYSYHSYKRQRHRPITVKVSEWFTTR